MTPLSDAETIALVRAAVAAPSADNRHVVRFARSGTSLRLIVDPSAVAAAPLHRRVFHELAFGAMIENLVLAAEGLGRVARVRRHRLWGDDPVMAEIELAEPSPVSRADPCRDAIFARTTNRRLYERSRKAPPGVLEDLAQCARARGDARVDWLDDRPRRARALRTILAAERERFANARLHRELFDAVRFDVGWHASAEVGLPPGALEVEAPLRPAFRALRHWTLQRTVNALGAAWLLGMRAAWIPAWTAPHIALLSVPSSPDADLVDGGRALQRLWLFATRHAMAFQPLAASIALASQDPGEAWVSASIAGRVRDELDALAGGRRAVMIARMGYAAAPTVRAERRPVESYLAAP